MKNYFDSSDVAYVASAMPTPLLVLDLDVIRRQLTDFTDALPGIVPFYSVKTNPHPAVLDTLKEFGSHYDVATLNEIKLVFSRGVDAGQLLYTHPVKTVAEIQEAAVLGVNAFTLDSLDELKRLQELVPTSHFFIRILTKKNSSLYDYKRKFGASLDETRQILQYAVDNGVSVSGLSFMVGSQSMSSQPWTDALETVRQLMQEFQAKLPALRVINIGSGFPLQYAFTDKVPTLPDVAAILSAARDQFPPESTFIAEPGRYIAGPAAAFLTRVTRRLQRDDTTWLYTDVNAYSGLIEVIESGGKFRYPITSNAGGKTAPFAVAGKTLDPDDIFAAEAQLGCDTTEGSILTIHVAGAYSTSFFTDYHSLPHPEIVVADSKYADNVELAQSGMQIEGVKAKRDIAAGETVFQITGYFVSERNRTTFQVDDDRHIEPTLFGAYLNHSCDPNVGLRTNAFGHYDVIARRDLKTGEDIAADYATFEYQTGPMSLVDCLCGSSKCRRRITGFKDLPDDLKTEYAGLIAAYLVEQPKTPLATPVYA